MGVHIKEASVEWGSTVMHHWKWGCTTPTDHLPIIWRYKYSSAPWWNLPLKKNHNYCHHNNPVFFSYHKKGQLSKTITKILQIRCCLQSPLRHESYTQLSISCLWGGGGGGGGTDKKRTSPKLHHSRQYLQLKVIPNIALRIITATI